MLIFRFFYLCIYVISIKLINNIFLHQQAFKMKKAQKQSSKNKISESWDVVFNRVYYRPSPISALRSFRESHIRSNEDMKMEIKIMVNQNKLKYKIIDVKADTDKLKPKQIVDLAMRAGYLPIFWTTTDSHS